MEEDYDEIYDDNWFEEALTILLVMVIDIV
jgi:hypothetical protein